MLRSTFVAARRLVSLGVPPAFFFLQLRGLRAVAGGVSPRRARAPALTIAPLSAPPGDGIPFFVTSDEEAGTAARTRVVAARASRARGALQSPDAALLDDAALSTDTETRIELLAGGDRATADSMLRATAKRRIRERRDATLAEAARGAALDGVLASELRRLEAGGTPRPLVLLPAGRGKGPFTPSSQPLLGAATLPGSHAAPMPAEIAAATLLLRAARALLAGARAPVGPDAPESLVAACDTLGVDISALRRRVEAEGAAVAEAARASAVARGELSDSSGELVFDSDGSSSEDGGIRSGRERAFEQLPDGGPPDAEPELAGIALPEEWVGGPRSALRFGGVAARDLPQEAPGDLHPAAAVPEIAPARAQIAEVRARSELATATRFLLRALAAGAEERGSVLATEGDTHIDVLPEGVGAGGGTGGGETAAVPLLQDGGTLPAALVSAAMLLTQGGGRGGVLARVLGGSGWLGLGRGPRDASFAASEARAESVDGGKPAPTPLRIRKAARTNRGGAVSALPLSGPGGIAALAGVSEGPLPPLGVAPPPPPPLHAEEEADLLETLGYPPRDPDTGLALVVDLPALEEARRARRAARRVDAASLAAGDAKREAIEFAAVNADDVDSMLALHDAAVEKDDAARADGGAPRALSRLPPGYRNWMEVAAAAEPPPRPGAAAAAASRQHAAVLNAVIRAPKDGTAPPTPRQTRASVNLRSALSAVLSDGAVGRLRADFPALFHGGLPLEVVEVALTPCLRQAHVRWTLPAMARLRGEVAAGTRPPRAPPPLAPFLPSARALIEAAERPREARAEALAAARRKPRKSDAFSPQSAVGGGVTPVLFGDGAAPSQARLARAASNAAAALEAAAWVLRREASARLRLRFVPRLHFFLWEGPRAEKAPAGSAFVDAAALTRSDSAPKAAPEKSARVRARATATAYSSAITGSL
jgi:hypothetical protein